MFYRCGCDWLVMAASPCDGLVDDPRCRRSRRIHYIPIKHPSRHCSWGQTPISTQVTRISCRGGVSPCFCDERWWQPSHFVADAPHAMCHFESALRVTPAGWPSCWGFFLRRFLEWMAAFAKTAGLVFSSECGREAICAALNTAVGHQTLLFCWIDSFFYPLEKPDDLLSLFSNLCFLKLWSAVNVGTYCSVTHMGIAIYYKYNLFLWLIWSIISYQWLL